MPITSGEHRTALRANRPLPRIGNALCPYRTRQTELLRFKQHHGGVRAALRRLDGSEEMCEAAYLAGCDGASSTVRGELAIGFPGGTYTGLFYVADLEGTGEPVDDNLHVDIEDADFILLFPLRSEERRVGKEF